MVFPSNRIAIQTFERKITFADMLRYASLFAQQTPGQGTKTIIFSENREGWIFALYAIWHNEATAVPVDAGCTSDDLRYIVHDCTPEAIWTSRGLLPTVEKAIEGTDTKILLIDDYEHADVSALDIADVPTPDERTALICYTSGTTGSPKGVMLSFRNVQVNIDAVTKESSVFNAERRSLVLLPLHHVLPLAGALLAPMSVQGGVAICPSLQPADIMRTLAEGHIGVMVGVPRLWQTLFRGIKKQIDARALTRALYNMCYRLQWRWLSKFIFSSVKKKMGGCLTYCVSGGAALDTETAMGLKTIGLDVLEGYGLTECAPMICFTRPGDIRPGCSGLPLDKVEVRIVNGELIARGPNIMQGYYNRPEETAKIIDAEGFIHTGDLASIGPEGHVTITGRTKEIIVLANGKNVNPTEIEFHLDCHEDIIKEIAITHADDRLCAIIVPQAAWAEGKSDEEMEEYLKREIIEPYNQSVAVYKKVMAVCIYHGQLPRTRLDKIQRFRLPQLLQELQQKTASPAPEAVAEADETFSEEFLIMRRYIQEEKHLLAHPTDHLETDLAFDSLDKVSFQTFLEQSFGCSISMSDIDGAKNLEALTALIQQRMTRSEAESIDWQQVLSQPTADIRLPHLAGWGRWLHRRLARLYHSYFGVTISGQENIPDGACILAPNHQSFLDGPLVLMGLTAEQQGDTYFYAKKDHVRSALRRHLASGLNVVVMDMSDLKTGILQLAAVLRQGKKVIIFPEGRRTSNGKLCDFKKLYAILAVELGVPVVPVRIDGAYDAMPRGAMWPKHHPLAVTYHHAIDAQPQDDHEAAYASLNEAVRDELSDGEGNFEF